MTAGEVAEVKFEGKVSTKFVFRHVRPRQKFSANKILWYERDVDDWIRSREERRVTLSQREGGMPRKYGNEKSYRFDMVLGGRWEHFEQEGRTKRRQVGGLRIRKSSGATNRTEHNNRETLIRKLYKQGKLGVLDARLEDRVTMEELIDAEQRNDGAIPADLGDLSISRKLFDLKDGELVLAEWVGDLIDSMKGGPETKRRYKEGWKRFIEVGPVDERFTVKELASVKWTVI